MNINIILLIYSITLYITRVTELNFRNLPGFLKKQLQVCKTDHLNTAAVGGFNESHMKTSGMNPAVLRCKHDTTVAMPQAKSLKHIQVCLLSCLFCFLNKWPNDLFSPSCSPEYLLLPWNKIFVTCSNIYEISNIFQQVFAAASCWLIFSVIWCSKLVGCHRSHSLGVFQCLLPGAGPLRIHVTVDATQVLAPW